MRHVRPVEALGYAHTPHRLTHSRTQRLTTCFSRHPPALHRYQDEFFFICAGPARTGSDGPLWPQGDPDPVPCDHCDGGAAICGALYCGAPLRPHAKQTICETCYMQLGPEARLDFEQTSLEMRMENKLTQRRVALVKMLLDIKIDVNARSPANGPNIHINANAEVPDILKTMLARRNTTALELCALPPHFACTHSAVPPVVSSPSAHVHVLAADGVCLSSAKMGVDARIIKELLLAGAHPTESCDRALLEYQVALTNREQDVRAVQRNRNCHEVREMFEDVRRASGSVGQRVRLRAMSVTKYTNRLGTLTKRWAGLGRLSVKLDGGPTISVHGSKVKLVDAAEEAEHDDGVKGDVDEEADELATSSARLEARLPGFKAGFTTISTGAGGGFDDDDCDESLPNSPSSPSAGAPSSSPVKDELGSPRASVRDLFKAAKQGDPVVLDRLLRVGGVALANSVDQCGVTLLRAVAFSATDRPTVRADCMRMLLVAKADPDACSTDPYEVAHPSKTKVEERIALAPKTTPLASATMLGFVEAVAVLLEFGAMHGSGTSAPDSGSQPVSSLGDENDENQIPILQVAALVCAYGRISKGASFYDKSGQSQLANRYLSIFNLLLERASYLLKLKVLNKAASSGGENAVKLIHLVTADPTVDPDAHIKQNFKGGVNATLHTWSALMHACHQRNHSCVQALLNAGANPSQAITVNQSHLGNDVKIQQSPMSIARKNNDKECVKILIGCLQRGQQLVGRTVRVEGFRRAEPAINGKIGEVLAFDSSTGQCSVKLDLSSKQKMHELSPTVLVEHDFDTPLLPSPSQSPPRRTEDSQRGPGGESEHSESSHASGSAEDISVSALHNLLPQAVFYGNEYETTVFLAARINPNEPVLLRQPLSEQDGSGKEGEEMLMTPLRAAVQHLVEADYSKEAFHILVLVMAGGADRYLKLEDGWSFNNAQLKDPMLTEMMRVGVSKWDAEVGQALIATIAGFERQFDDDATAEKMVIQRLRMLEKVCDSDPDLSLADRTLLVTVAVAGMFFDECATMTAAMIANGANPSVKVGNSPVQFSPLYLEYESGTNQPSAMLRALLAGGADFMEELQLRHGVKWSLADAAKQREDRDTYQLLTNIHSYQAMYQRSLEEIECAEIGHAARASGARISALDENDEELEVLDLETPDMAVEHLLLHGERLGQKFGSLYYFMHRLPRGWARSVVTILCEIMSRAMDKGDAGASLQLVAQQFVDRGEPAVRRRR